MFMIVLPSKLDYVVY